MPFAWWEHCPFSAPPTLFLGEHVPCMPPGSAASVAHRHTHLRLYLYRHTQTHTCTHTYNMRALIYTHTYKFAICYINKNVR